MEGKVYFSLSVAFKMDGELRLVVVVASLLMMSAADTPQENVTTLDDVVIGRVGVRLYEWCEYRMHTHYTDTLLRRWTSVYNGSFWNDKFIPIDKKILKQIFDYASVIAIEPMIRFSKDLGNVTVQSIFEDLNGRCSEYLDAPVNDLRVELNDSTCVTHQLVKWLTVRLIETFDVTLQQLSNYCIRRKLTICSTEHRNCTTSFEGHVRRLLRSYVGAFFDVQTRLGETPLDIILAHMQTCMIMLWLPFDAIGTTLLSAAVIYSSLPSIEPLSFENLMYNFYGNAGLIKTEENTASEDDFTWGIVRSYKGSVDFPCSEYRVVYSRDSKLFYKYFFRCYTWGAIKYSGKLLSCLYRNATSTPLAWSTVPSIYVNSQCLCVATNGRDCRVKPPPGVDPRTYCLSVLLRDFQRHVWFRPAVTYLDYASMTRVPVCKFTTYLTLAFRNICNGVSLDRGWSYNPSPKCFFKDLVNKVLNCSETLPVKDYNRNELCAAKAFLQFILCEDKTNIGGDQVDLPYYGVGDSPLVLGMTYVDVAVRVLTLVTYLACPQLRNIPGKLLIGYQTTALLRLVVVRATLEDLPLAVRLDVSLDLASTLWLTAYLHFLTSSIKTLRLPDSLSPSEAREVLLRYSLWGWLLPAALSTAFFFLDEVLYTRVQVGQLSFLLCNYAALLSNLYMFHHNLSFYYDVKTSARDFKQSVKTRSVVADLFNFALKTSLLSGAGIVFRLVFTQIQGLEHVLSYYHALGTLHGLLLFLLYGCNREARAFWTNSVFRSILRQNTPRRRNSMELEQIPRRNGATDDVMQ